MLLIANFRIACTRGPVRLRISYRDESQVFAPESQLRRPVHASRAVFGRLYPILDWKWREGVVQQPKLQRY